MMQALWNGIMLAVGWSLGGVLVIAAVFAVILAVIGCVFALAAVLDGIEKLRKWRRAKHG